MHQHDDADGEEHRHDPGQASRDGLQDLHAHEHPTTERVSSAHDDGPEMPGAPGEAHRGGPLPYMKR